MIDDNRPITKDDIGDCVDAERERCARLVENARDAWENYPGGHDIWQSLGDLADRIRSGVEAAP